MSFLCHNCGSLSCDGCYSEETNEPFVTKRELFAAMAMQGLRMWSGSGGMSSKEIAADAVIDADALIAELEKKEEKS